jgi:alpha-amylase
MRGRSARLPVAAAAAIALAASLLSGCTPPREAPQPQVRHDVGIQLFEWPWTSIATECTDELGPSGIAWVLTSPPNEHVQGPQWWTSYQPVSYLVESKLGTRDEFAAMVETCAQAGVEIIADAVINHMTGRETGIGVAGSRFEHYGYPGIYEPGDFHHCTESPTGDIQDYRDAAEVQNCELVNLADLDTASAHVRRTLVAYLEDLLSLGVAGFRIDAAKHMPADDVSAIVAALPEGTRILQEVIRGAREPITPEEYVRNGQVFEFAFARDLKSMVQSATLDHGMSFGEKFGHLASDDAIVFADNHDTERNGQTLSQADGDAYLLANAFLLAQPYGTPVLFSGYGFDSTDAGPEQDATGRVLDVQCDPDAEKPGAPPFSAAEWTCTQRWPEVRGMLAWRSAVGHAQVTDEWGDRYGYAFGRGDYGYIVLNTGADPLERTFQTSLAPGAYVDAISGDEIVVAGDGSFTATVHGMTALAISVADYSPR